jgi:AcrR family transcriptional regulator
MKTRRSTPKSLRNPRQDRSRATVDAILEAAARILEREGPEGLGTNRIARDAGVSIGSLYEYFDGRDAIVRTLCERHLDVVRAVTDQAFELIEHAPDEVAVDQFVDALFAFYEARPRLRRALHFELPLRLSQQPFLDNDRYVERRLIEWLARRSGASDPSALEARAFVLVRAGRAVIIQAITEELAPERQASVRAALKLVLLSGIAR